MTEATPPGDGESLPPPPPPPPAQPGAAGDGTDLVVPEEPTPGSESEAAVPAGLEVGVPVEDAIAAGDVEFEIEEKPDRFRTGVAAAIALVSILGALVAFRGSLAEQDARALNQQGIQEAAQQQQILTKIDAQVNADVRYVEQYQLHRKAAEILTAQAKTADGEGHGALATTLRAESADELTIAATVYTFFRSGFPDDPGSGKPLTFDREAARARMEAQDSELPNLHPDETLERGDALGKKAVYLVGLVTLFIGSLLFLTLAQFTRPSIRRFFAGAGGVFAIGGAVLWVVVERAIQ